MKGKILFVAGLGIGYVLGTRAGREQYEKLKSQVARIWNDPRVQRQVDAAEEFVKDKAPDVAEFVGDQAKKVVAQVSGRKTPARATRTTTRGTTSRTTRSETSGTGSSGSSGSRGSSGSGSAATE